MGVQTVALILKDTMNNKPAGDPKYMPTDLHVEVVLLSKDASYVAPSGDAGAGGRAGASGSAGAAVSGGHGGGAGHAAGRGGAGTSAHGGAGGVERAGSGGHAGAIASAADGGDDEDAGLDAGTVVADAGAAGQVGAGSANDAGSPTTHRSKGCSAVASREQPQHLGAIAVAFGWLAFARRRRISELCAPARADRR
jgi:hypothetical protein